MLLFNSIANISDALEFFILFPPFLP